MNGMSAGRLLTRRGLLGGAAAAVMAGAAGPALGEITRSPRPLARPPGFHKRAAPSVAALVGEAELGGALGFAVADCADGEMREVLNPLRGMAPASTAKAITALYALEALGPGHVFSTRAVAAGPVVDGVLEGDLILEGSGDPTLDTDGLAALAAALRAAGLARVTGRLRVDAAALPELWEIDRGQLPHAGYNPALGGLNLNYNRVHFEWKRAGGGYETSMEARSEAYRPPVRMARISIAERRGPVFTYEDRDGVDSWSVARGALGNGGARWLPVRRPAAYAVEVFARLCAGQGIAVELGDPAPGGAARLLKGGGVVLGSRESPPLVMILEDMLRYSTNLTAEVVGLASSQAFGHAPASLAESGAAMSAWAAETFGTRRMALVDHSGLGEDSRVAAGDMARLLVHPRALALLRPLLKPVAMLESRSRVRGVEPEVVAKTGTLDFVSGLVGYVTAPDGTLMGFAIFAGDLERRARAHETGQENVPGAKGWNARAKTLQQGLLERWALVHAAS